MELIKTPSITKVTLSCRVTPEQKFFIANKAKELGMSTAQYTEAKILQQDDITLERRVAQLQQEKKELQDYMKKIVALKDDLYSWFEEYDMITDFHMECGHYEFWEDNPFKDDDEDYRSTPPTHIVEEESTQKEIVMKEVEKQSTPAPQPTQEQPPKPQPSKVENLPPPRPHFTIYFPSTQSLQIFRSQLDYLHQSMGMKNWDDVAIMCVDYTTANKKSTFFLERVKEFVKKKNY